MLTPEFLHNLPDGMAELYASAEMDILNDMARRINGYDTFITSAQHQMKMLEEMGELRENIISTLAELTGKTQKELTSIMRAAGVETLGVDDVIYKAAGLKPSALKASTAFKKTLAAGFKKTSGTFKNLTKTTAAAASQQFGEVLDKTYMLVSSGAMDKNTAIKNAIKELAGQGVSAVEYSSGRVDSLETAVRRATVTGVNQTMLEMQEARADEMGVDLVETTAHAGARPSHALWQGEIFSRSGKSKKYPGLRQVTGYGTVGGLGGVNCSHSFRPYIDGMPRTYSKEQLDDYAAKNYTYNGKKMTEYEALQQQREIERNIRKYKRENTAMKAAGQDTTESAAKLSKWQNTQKDFLGQTGLKRQADREYIAGWGRSQASKASYDARILKSMEKDAILKAKSGLPKVLKVADTVVPRTMDVSLPNLSGVVPKGSTLSSVRVLAGDGTSVPIRDWKRLYNSYGGDPRLWQKKTGTVKTDNYSYEVHWYERDGVVPEGEEKLKRVKSL